jgi:hypothetical protein
VFTARYALNPYIKQIRFVFNGLINVMSLLYAACSVAKSGRGCSKIFLEPHYYFNLNCCDFCSLFTIVTLKFSCTACK